MTIIGAQVKDARRLLGWTRTTLAAKCKPGETTIRNFENVTRRPSPFNVMAIRRALEFAGVEFVDESGAGPGARLRQSE